MVKPPSHTCTITAREVGGWGGREREGWIKERLGKEHLDFWLL